MTKLNHDKLRRVDRSRQVQEKKVGGVNDFSGEEEQDELTAVVEPRFSYVPLKQHQLIFETIIHFIDMVTEGEYATLTHDARIRFLTDFYKLHMNLYMSMEENYYKTSQYRWAERFFDSNGHLFDKNAYWKGK